ncbi:MAG TPA: cyclic nucleotide-binding domain-containing protein, partial [Polyangia bacterium]|nr:cyclic nucleotide-binding domain-containing protein [Polyangia bacterium]
MNPVGTQTTTETVASRAQLQQLLARDPPLSSLGRDVIRELVDASDLIAVPGGTCLVHAGETLDALLGVVHGSLRVLQPSGDGAKTVREFYRGDTLGVMGMLSDRPFPVDLYAVRDSTLLRLPRARVLALAAKHPTLLLALAQMMGERAFDVLETSVGQRMARVTARAGNLALLSLSDNGALGEVAQQLLRALAAEGRLTRVSAALVDEVFGAGTAASARSESAVTAWLSQL